MTKAYRILWKMLPEANKDVALNEKDDVPYDTWEHGHADGFLEGIEMAMEALEPEWVTLVKERLPEEHAQLLIDAVLEYDYLKEEYEDASPHVIVKQMGWDSFPGRDFWTDLYNHLTFNKTPLPIIPTKPKTK